MGHKAGYCLRWQAMVHNAGLIAIALFSFHAISSLVFSVVGLAPSSPKWGLALTLEGFLIAAGTAAGLRSLPFSETTMAQRLTGLVSGGASLAILGFYTLGQLTGQQAQWAITGAVVGCLVGGRLGIARARFWQVAIALTSGLCAYGAAFGLGTWAWAAIMVQRWTLVLGLGLGTGLYLWFTRRAMAMAWRHWRYGPGGR